MRALNAYIEHRLDFAARRWKWLRFLQFSATLGIIATLLVLLLGVGAFSGWLTNKTAVLACMGFVIGGAFLVWFILGLAVAASRPQEGWLGEKVEASCPRLLDRLNTLLYLGGRPKAAHDESFYRRIEGQALGVFARERPQSPFTSYRALAHLAAFVLLVFATSWFFQRFSPLQQLHAYPPPPAQESFEIPPLKEEPERIVEPWGEVRITRPGRDLTVTRLETVPLQIEAAANRALTGVEWYSALNGRAESKHELPSPTDPSFVVYNPEIVLQEFGLGDWDVLSYYAKATAEDGVSYVSQTYFIEIMPLREELRKIPGGRGGKPYSALDILTAMIKQQEEVVQETHRQLYRPDQEPAADDPELATPDGLAKREEELATAGAHFSAMISGQFDDPGLDGVVTHLGRAQKSLSSAAGSYRQRSLPQADPEARNALAELIEARKELHQRMRENSDLYTPPTMSREELERLLAERLRRVSELAEEAKQAAEAVRALAEQQQRIADQASSSSLRPSQRQAMAGEEDEIGRQLAALQAQFPGVFKPLDEQSAAAQGSVQQAANAFRRNDRIQSPQRAQSAAEQLDQLAQALEDQTLARQLAKAYQLRAMLDQQIKMAEGIRQQPGSMSQPELQQEADQVKQTTGELKQLMEEGMIGRFFGPPLHEALSDENKAELDARSDNLPPAPLTEPRQQAAGQLKDGLQQLADAFDASQPGMMAGGGGGQDSLMPGGMQSLARAMSQLQSLLGMTYGGQDGGGIYRGPRLRLQQEALENLLSAIESLQRKDLLDDKLLKLLREKLRNREELDPKEIEELLTKLQNLTIEIVELRKKDDENPDGQYIDPSKLPPSYRQRIQKYFEMLSSEDGG